MTLTGTSLENTSQRIKLLPEHLVDQIKAGEVIERPASLIKEIMENSLDAGADEIELHLINNGLDLISLEDNGKGMTYEDLPYAFCRHATSKISRFEDLYSLKSFGFRGEALASIAAISKVTCTSSPSENHPEGGKIVFQAGAEKAHEKQENLRKGTSLYIKDLFFNTPARLKFIKSAQSEKNAIKRIIDSFIIANPKVKFVVKWDEEDKEVFPATSSAHQRVARLFNPRKKKPEVWEFSGEYEGHKVHGYLSQNSTKGNAHKKNFLFGNSRLFTDRQIHQTILRSAERHYPMGESGHYCVFIDVPESLIDVNVHPNKTQIKFFKLSVITALLSSEIKKIDIGEAQQDLLTSQDQSSSKGSFSSSAGSIQQKVDPSSLFSSSHLGRAHYAYSAVNEAQTQARQFQLIEGDSTLLLHKERLLDHVFTYLQSIEHKADNDFIPLMICEPLEGKSEKISRESILKEMEGRGFLCEFLDENTLALRGYHQIYNGLSQIHVLAQHVYSTLIQEGQEVSSLSFNTSWVLKMGEHFSGSRSQFLLPLDSHFIEKNFNQ